jgi:hypothetical protein
MTKIFNTVGGLQLPPYWLTIQNMCTDIAALFNTQAIQNCKYSDRHAKQLAYIIIKHQEGKSTQVVPCYSKNELRSINRNGAQLQILTSYANQELWGKNRIKNTDTNYIR